MWQAIGLVSSGITLVAFIVAAAAWVFRQHAVREERLIRTAAEADRAKLVTAALEFFNVDTQKLTKDQRYEIAIEQIRARARRFLIACVVVVVVAFLAVGVATFAIMRHSGNDNSEVGKDVAVVIMDSPLRDVVYDQAAWLKGRTNADELTEMLKDLPGVVLYKETTSLQWEREDQVLKMHPRLIIIHASCFYDSTNVVDPDRKFFSFLQYLASSDARFLVYSRGFHHGGESWKASLVQLIPKLNARLEVFEIPPPGTFSDPVIRRRFKTLVKEALSL
jgi:hypothetical protein